MKMSISKKGEVIWVFGTHELQTPLILAQYIRACDEKAREKLVTHCLDIAEVIEAQKPKLTLVREEDQ